MSGVGDPHLLAVKQPLVSLFFYPCVTTATKYNLARYKPALVFNPLTSDPAPGSVTAYETLRKNQKICVTRRKKEAKKNLIGDSAQRPKYFFFCSVVPAKNTGAWAKSFANIAVLEKT
jgi:hypothetical protein